MAWMDRLKNKDVVQSRVKYEEIPLMVSQSGKLVCIEVKGDMPTIGILGVKGSGKSRLFHSILDSVYHKRKKDGVMVLNDQHNESLTYSMKGHFTRTGGSKPTKEDDKWIAQLELLGMKPSRLPVVHCYPAISDGYEDAPDNICKIKISLRQESLFKSEQIFGEKNLKGSTRYLRAIKEHLMKTKSFEEAEGIIFQYVDNQSVQEKLRMLVRNLYQEKIISFDQDIISKAKLKDLKNNQSLTLPVLLSILPARCIPILMTRQLQNAKDFLI